MTSDQIKDAQPMRHEWLKEIAYQLAVLNEREDKNYKQGLDVNVITVNS